MTIRLGTRGSALALAQSRLVADAIASALAEPVELVQIVTDGDRSTAPVPELGVGVFVSALRDALAAKEIDIAVHSYKDLPTAPVDGLVIAAVPPREDPRDVLISSGGRTLEQLPAGARIGTGAVRRVAQLRALRRDFECVPMRGNVDTRLRKLAEGRADALVLAAAGLRRLGRAAEMTQVLDPETMLPAPAQGALAVECRCADHSLVERLRRIDDEHTRAAVTAERTLMAALEAGCSAPVAALADVVDTVDGGLRVHVSAAVFAVDGTRAVRGRDTGPLSDAVGVGSRLAAQLLAAGADLLLGENPAPGASLPSEKRTLHAGPKGDSA
ncbi:MAG TPA: hydroxymethylbilane synthase [Micromonosporaceae bacterium]|jgi:hydroxymethylbilane synthase